MHPIVYELTLGGVTRPIGGYGLAISIGMLLCSVITVRAASRAKEDVGAAIACSGYTIAGGLAGAWLAFLVIEWIRTGSPIAALSTGGGLVFYGAVPGGALAAYLGARGLGVPFAKTADLAVPGFAAGHAIGRIGCFLGGCCYGAPWDGPLAVTFTDPMAPASHPPIPRHPVQLYESAGLVVLGLAFTLVPIGRTDGSRALAYVVAYGVLRTMTEALRGDAVRGVWGFLSTSQIVSIAFVALALAALFRLRRARSSIAMRAVIVLALGSLALGGWLAQLAVVPPRVEELRVERDPIVWIPEGDFSMGASEPDDLVYAITLCQDEHDLAIAEGCDRRRFQDELGVHRVRLPAFGIDRTEVTNLAWRRCVVASRCAPQRIGDDDPRLGADDLPVASVTSDEAAAYCAHVGGRLPTEQEWEKAARGDSRRRFPWGRYYHSRLANHGRPPMRPDAGDGWRWASPVGSFPDGASPYGVLDMAGNVWEWTSSVPTADDFVAVGVVSGMDPSGFRVVRGGSWSHPAVSLRVTQRLFVSGSEPRADIGLRCAYDPP